MDHRIRGSLLDADHPDTGSFFHANPQPVLQGPNALCLDYSAGKDGPLVTYEFHSGETVLSLGQVRVHGSPA